MIKINLIEDEKIRRKRERAQNKKLRKEKRAKMIWDLRLRFESWKQKYRIGNINFWMGHILALAGSVCFSMAVSNIYLGLAVFFILASLGQFVHSALKRENTLVDDFIKVFNLIKENS